MLDGSECNEGWRARTLNLGFRASDLGFRA